MTHPMLNVQTTLKPKANECIFAYYKKWIKGETLHISKEHYGCGGAGRWMCGVETRAKEDFLTFLVDGEGLKASKELMEKWIIKRKPYDSIHKNIFIDHLKIVSGII